MRGITVAGMDTCPAPTRAEEIQASSLWWFSRADPLFNARADGIRFCQDAKFCDVLPVRSIGLGPGVAMNGADVDGGQFRLPCIVT